MDSKRITSGLPPATTRVGTTPTQAPHPHAAGPKARRRGAQSLEEPPSQEAQSYSEKSAEAAGRRPIGAATAVDHAEPMAIEASQAGHAAAPNELRQGLSRPLRSFDEYRRSGGRSASASAPSASAAEHSQLRALADRLGAQWAQSPHKQQAQQSLVAFDARLGARPTAD